MHRIGSRRSLRTIIDQCTASDTGNIAVRAHGAGGCSFLDECHELPENDGFEPGHLMDYAHRGVLWPFRRVTGVARQRRGGLGGTSGRMNEDDLIIAGFNHHERSVVVEHCGFGCHDAILGLVSLAGRSRIEPASGIRSATVPGRGSRLSATGAVQPSQDLTHRDFLYAVTRRGRPPEPGPDAARHNQRSSPASAWRRRGESDAAGAAAPAPPSPRRPRRPAPAGTPWSAHRSRSGPAATRPATGLQNHHEPQNGYIATLLTKARPLGTEPALCPMSYALCQDVRPWGAPG
jgi:hypothetical protein